MRWHAGHDRPQRSRGARGRRRSAGDASSGSPQIGIADTDLRRRSGACCEWLAAGCHGDDGLYGAARREARAAGGARAGHAARHHRAHGLLARDARPRRSRRPRRSGAARTCRATRSDATTTRCCARGCSGSPTASRAAVGDVRPPRVHRQRAGARGRARGARPGSAGAASTRCCSRATRGSLFFLGEIYTDLPLPVDAGASAHCGSCTRLHRRLPDRRHRRALRARRAALHLLPDDRARGRDPRGAAPADRQSRLRLRRLPARLPLESSSRTRPSERRLRRAPRPRRARPRRPVRLDRGRVRRAHARAARSGASATSAGCAISPSASAMRRVQRSIVAALERRADDPSPLVREHVAWALAQQRGRVAPLA